MSSPVAFEKPQRAGNRMYGTSPGRYQYLMRDGDEEAFCNEGVRLSRKKLQSEAIYWFNQALRRKPDFIPALLGKGFALGKLGQSDEEIQICERVLELDPDSVDAWLQKGYALGKMDRFEEKIACCDTALKINPNSAEAWNMKGQALGMLNQWNVEFDCCNNATTLNPRYIGAWVNKGYALMQLERYREAISCFNHAIRIYPEYCTAWINKGVSYCLSGDNDRAVSCFDRAERMCAVNPRTLYWKGLALSRVGRYKEAIDYLSQVIASDTHYADAWVVMSNCHFMLGNLDESGRCFMIAYGIDKKDIKDLLSKGMAHVMQGNRREALQCMSGIFGILLR